MFTFQLTPLTEAATVLITAGPMRAPLCFISHVGVIGGRCLLIVVMNAARHLRTLSDDLCTHARWGKSTLLSGLF